MFLFRAKKQRLHWGVSDPSDKQDYIYVADPRGSMKTEFVNRMDAAKLPYEDLDIPIERWRDSTREGSIFPPVSSLKKNAKLVLHVLDAADANDAGVSEAVQDLTKYNQVVIVEDKKISAIHDALKQSRGDRHQIFCGIPSDRVVHTLSNLLSCDGSQSKP